MSYTQSQVFISHCLFNMSLSCYCFSPTVECQLIILDHLFLSACLFFFLPLCFLSFILESLISQILCFLAFDLLKSHRVLDFFFYFCHIFSGLQFTFALRVISTGSQRLLPPYSAQVCSLECLGTEAGPPCAKHTWACWASTPAHALMRLLVWVLEIGPDVL